jgi:hypothetical protein
MQHESTGPTTIKAPHSYRNCLSIVVQQKWICLEEKTLETVAGRHNDDLSTISMPYVLPSNETEQGESDAQTVVQIRKDNRHALREKQNLSPVPLTSL